jgi:hypothetical protein
MLVSDIDDVNIDYASKNVIVNKMSDQIIGKNLVFWFKIFLSNV